MTKYFITTVLLFVFFNNSYAQRSTLLDIQEIKIKDSDFVYMITKFIEEQKSGKDAFGFFKKGLGYVTVQISDYHHQDTLLRYQVLTQAIGFDKKISDFLYPPYYTIIDGHPVLLYLHSLSLIANVQYSEKSKNKFRKVTDPFLAKLIDIDFHDRQDKIDTSLKYFKNEVFNFTGGEIRYKLGRQYDY